MTVDHLLMQMNPGQLAGYVMLQNAQNVMASRYGQMQGYGSSNMQVSFISQLPPRHGKSSTQCCMRMHQQMIAMLAADCTLFITI